ncbi:IPTL-CTERM sorting domain-containing protein [Candidatus Thiothrix anitrata]|uniref:IPTL-CTERM sorting domain-containing protein n=1 Tax=Candidatus Thiothrix anitrata TaxID=2823902 RepID=A0ABX7X1F0_9GAMM|nr:IPTL-CTERM sorting domain-containing protein [Candidatus Thiothrix anitrata]QTR49426.1 IPTL-CTERM sorting domain-containing protein [Candidatus Thiothrix anitrata]
MKISKVLLWIGVLWFMLAAQVSWAESITNCTHITQGTPTDVDSTPGNFNGTPAEDDESCAVITLQNDDYDFGDAPDPSYPTLLSNNGARHIQKDNTLHLGSCVDKDEDGQPNSNALGDDTGNGASVIGSCANGDDEDGVTFSELKVGAQDVTINVSANQACRLNAWIDWSGNGSWGDLGDQIATDQLLAIGNNTLTLDVPASARPGATYARFRCSTAGGDGVTGEAADGEIEDYRITITAAVPKIDLKKYVQNAAGAPAYDNANESATLGDDAQEFVSGIILPYGSDALYRIRVENTGSTKLNEVTVDDQIEACDPLTKIYDSNNATPDGVMSKGEVWVLECTLPALKQDIVNTAKVRGIPVNEDDTPTGQSPVDSHDPANVRIPLGQPAIELKKYVRPVGAAAGSPLEKDAEDMSDALVIDHKASVTYRMVVRNVGNTPLTNVVLTEHMDDCAVTKTIGVGDTLLDPAEFWEYECTKANMTVAMENIADVEAKPANPDGTPTTQSPVRDLDPANVKLREGNPAISLKKYVVANGADNDAQDAAAAVMIDAGATVNYKLVVTNTGNTALGTVDVQDNLTGCNLSTVVGDTGNDSIMSVGEVWTYTCSVPNVRVDTLNLATVSAIPVNADGSPTNQSQVSSEDPANVRVRVERPAISLKKYVRIDGTPENTEVDAQDMGSALMVSHGDKVTYRMVVTNTGNSLLADVLLDDQLAGCTNPVRIDTNNADTFLSPNEAWVYQCTGVVTEVDTYNLATVTAKPANADGTPTTQSPVSDEDPANVRIRINQPAISLKKYVVAGGNDYDAQDAGRAVLINAGDSVTYKFVVTNTGNTILGEVDLTEQLDGCAVGSVAGDTGGDGLMALGEVWTYTCNKADVRVDTQNYATVVATPVNSDGSPTGQSPVNDGDPANVRIPLGQPAIELKKYVRPVGAAAGSPLEKDAEDMSDALVIDHKASVTYRMVVRNVGNTPLTNVVLTEHMDDCAVTKTVGIGDTLLDPAEFWEYECTKANMTVAMENIADVEAKPANPDGTPTTQSPVRDLDPANVKLREGAPAISLKKYVVANGTDNDAQDAAAAVMIDAGATVNYKLVATNTGNTALGTVDVQDNLTGCNLSTVAGDTGNDSIMSMGEVWTYTCSVADVRVDTLNLATVTAKPVNADGTPTNQSQVTSEDPANVRIPLGQPAIELKKYVQNAATAPAFNAATPLVGLGQEAQDMSTAVVLPHGSTAMYRMVVTNIGNTPLAQVQLTEHLEGCAVNRVYNGDADAKDLLKSGEFWIYQCTKANITLDMQNVASVEAKPANPDGSLTTQSPVDDEDPANVRIGQNLPAIELIKYVRKAGDPAPGNDAQDNLHALPVKHGDNVTYRIEVRNTGSTALASVKVDDHLPDCNLPSKPVSGDAGTTDLLETGEVWVYECNQNNVTTDVYNLATVTAVPAHANGTPTGQSPVNDEDPANVSIPLAQPAIALQKYVRLEGTPAPGSDAQDALHALLVNHNSNVIYRIVVRNTGNTALANVDVEDSLEGCDLPTNPVGDDGDKLLETGELWSYECTQTGVTTDVYNLATVVAQPAHDNGTPTTQSPVMAQDAANVRIPSKQPALELKKYVRLDGTAAPGIDAQDNLNALLVKHGDTVTYRITVRNTGGTALSNVKVDDHLRDCTLPDSPQSGDNGNDLLDTGELWVYECSQADVTQDVYNLATVVATPANADGSPTGQSPITDEDPANVRIPLAQPAIELKKYVRVAGTAVGTELDAQDASAALMVEHNTNVTYRITVRNLGNALLGDVKVDDHLENCALAPVDLGDLDAANTLKQGETWIFECTQTGVKVDTYNLATVEAVPLHDDGTPTTQSPVDDEDPANVRIRKELPAISLKKYVRPQGAAAPGNDAQDALHAETVAYGSNVTYRIEVRNIGKTPLINVKVDDHLEACNLPANPQSGDTGNDGKLDLTEVWVYECDQTNVTTDVYNLATVKAVPANADGTPTNQSPVDDEDPANVHVQVTGPTITLKKYVQPAANAPAYDANNSATLGLDAQDTLHAQMLEFGNNALFRIVVKNTGTTWLDSVKVEDHLDTCNPFTRIHTSVNNDEVMSPGEFWVYECSVPDVTENLANLASVEARPVQEDGKPTGQSPVDAKDMANVMIPVKQPAIAMKKYVRKVGAAAPGNDAQDNLNALTVAHGENVIYHIEVRNIGDTVLGYVKVDDYLKDCALNPLSLADGDSLLGINEAWTYECTQANVTQDVYNLAAVEATPVFADGTPTGQSPVNAQDPANVRIPLDGPSIAVKKYVQAADGAPTYVSGNVATLGKDAQDATTAAYVQYDTDALYRIVVKNTGTTWLDQVAVEDSIENCALTRIDSGDSDINDTLKPDESWVYECQLAKVNEDIRNLATASARPIHADLAPTGQSPVSSSDPAHVTTELAPKIALKKYVQAADGALVYNALDDATLGFDAQNASAATFITKDKAALYRITVTNTGNTWLDQVMADDQLTNCAISNIDKGDNDAANTLKPGERWVYECTLANIKENIRNTATVEARPINPDGTPTNQSPVDDSDVAHVTTELAPKIALKKYVQAATSAVAYSAADDATLGVDAQDATTATFITKDASALYRITVTNTGNTWLDQVVVDDQLANCDLGTAPIDQGDNDAANTLKPGERWVYQCTLANIKENIRNTATVEARPINPDGTPTNQSPVDDSDVAHVTTELAPKIALKKYVQAADGAMAYDAADNATLGVDAQDATAAAFIVKDQSALYRIAVTNTGNTWLDQVVVDDQLANCDLGTAPIDQGDNDVAKTLKPGERWVYECTLANIKENIRNTATVEARPINPDGTPTNQSPVDDSDVAHVTTELAPKIALKKYVQAADGAMAYDAADNATLGVDAQDATAAAFIVKDQSALYRIAVTNTGNTWLDQVVVDDQLTNCDLGTAPIDQGDNDVAKTLKPGERWVYECTLANIKENIRNTATVEARPINPDGTPTNQSPVDDSDVAHVTTELAPKIALKKYVQAATSAVAYSAADDATLGVDAQDATTATFITKDASALYRITVTNTGNTWLDQVVVDDQLANCDLGTAPIDQGDNDAANTLKPGERWVYQCTLANIKENIRNTATVEARPINPDGTPTNQSPVDDSDVAHVTTELAPKIALKKYVQAADGAMAYDAADNATLGVDAQDATAAAFIVKDKSALYRIAVTNTGNTWLDQVVVDDQLANCDLGTAPIDQGDNDVAKTLKPGERWVYECTLANIKENIRNTATVEARPINPDGTPTNQSPVDDSDVAHVTTELAPKIALKKYVQAADGAMAYDAADNATLGVDAQDATAAAFIVKDQSALYRIAVTNTGNTWLDQVVVDDQLTNCDLGTAPIDQGDNDVAKTLKPGERWVYECTLANIKENIRNTATVEARPINPDGTPTNQSPVDDSDVAHVTTELAPKIALKKYVQPLEGAPAFDVTDATTWGYDAQDTTSAVHIPYDKTALYRIVVTNKGNTWLDTVTVDDQLDNCVLASIDDGNGNATLQPEESWVYECTLAKVNEDIRNTATVQARPVNPDGTPTNQSPVDASDVAHVTTELRPSILLKKYAQAADKAKAYDRNDDSTLGLDAQDETSAAYVMYDAPALYYITVTNTGNTWLKEIAVDDKLAGCNATALDSADGDAFLAPEERWVYTCELAKATQPISNLATVTAKPINPDGTPTNQSPVSSEDVAHIRTHKGHSLGNYLWIDDGNSIALNRDNGKVDKGEKPVDDGVELELNDASGNPVNLGNGIITTKTSGGYYLFSALPPGEYQVCVAASNFATGGLLAGYLVSSVNEGDPNADQDQNNNGLPPADANGKVCSGIITLDDDEPTKEYPTASGQAGNDAAGSADNASNLSIDFAFVPQEVGVGNRLWIDEGVSPTSTNNGVYDEGEPPLASVMVEVYRQGDDPDVDMAIGVTETDRFGCYSFEHLRPGSYFVHVPYYQVVLDSSLELKPLYAYLSSKGNDGDTGVDDTQGENGIDELATLALSGIKTDSFTLMPGQEPTDERACGKTTPATLADDSYDGTQDIGVLRYMQLGNYVWFDRNANGIQDAGEVGIENATAELFLADGTTQALDIHGNPVAPVKTDATGKYLFTALAPGEYVVRVTPPQEDYMVSPKVVIDPNNDDNSDSNAQAVPEQVYAQSGVVKLAYDSEPMHDGDLENPNSNLTVDFGFYIPVAVGDRVWLDRNGNGQQDPEDLNIGGAIVTLYAADGVTPVKDAYDRAVEPQTTTDSGQYYFDYLLEGEYIITVKAPSEVYLPTKGGIDADDDGSDTDSNALLLVEGVSSSLPFTLTARTEPTADNEVANVRDSSSNRSVDFGFIRPLAVGDFIWSDTNANGIQDDAEKGMVGSRVNLLTSAGNPVTNLKGETVAEIVVDETGVYRFEMLMEGQYVVRVNPPADYIASKPEAVTDITKDSNCEATDTKELFQTKVQELRFNGQPETSVDGDNSDRDMTLDCGFFAPVGVGDLIWEDSNGDGEQTAGEPGILGAKVALLTSDGLQPVDIHGNEVTAFTTLADGKYQFKDLFPGDYIVQVTPPDGYHLTKGDADPDENPSNKDNNCVAAESKIQTKVFSLLGGTEPAAEVDGDDHNHDSTVDCGFTRSTAIGGPVWVDLNADGVQVQGEPSIPGLEVKLTDCANNTVANIYGEIVPPTVTDANGLYRFDKLKAGNYCVIVKNPPSYRPTLAVENPNGNEETANIDSNGAIQLDGYVSSSTVNLSWNQEPVNDGDNDPSTNLTIGFGFIPMLAIPTVSQWSLIMMSLMLMLAGVYWQRRRN